MRAGNAQVERNLARRVVGHRAGIVVVRPVLRVVVVALQQIHFVFGLDVAVLGNAHVDAHRRAVDVFPVEARIDHRLVGAKDADAAGPRAATDLFAFLVAKLVEVANPRQGGAKIAGFVGLDPAPPLQ